MADNLLYRIIWFSGVSIAWTKNQTWCNIVSVIRAFFLFGIGAYLTATQIYRIATKSTTGGVSTSHMLLASWHFQSTLSVVGYFGAHLVLLSFPLWKNPWRLHDEILFKKTDVNDAPHVRRILRRTFVASGAVYLVCVLFLLALALVQVLTTARRSITNLKGTTIFGIPNTWPLYMALANWQLAVWFIMLAIYMTVCQVIHHRLLALLVSIKKHNEKSGLTAAELIEWIPKKHDEHVKLAEMIHIADEVFQVYVFAMLATNIPTTIFTLLAFLQRMKVSCIDAAFSVPEIGLCLFQLTAVTLTPDRIHRAVRAPARLMHASAHLWTPYNEHVYHVLSVFVNNSSLSDVGISIWGFALVTKSVILTIISLATTYLTVLMEFQNGGDCATTGPTTSSNATSVT